MHPVLFIINVSNLRCSSMSLDFGSSHIKIIAVAIVAIIIGVAIWSYLESKQTDEAPDFTVTDLDGDTFTLSEFLDQKVVLIDFMSTTCPSCEEEMPELVKIYNKYGDRIEMISIDIAGVGEDGEDDLRDFMEDYNAHWRAALDTDDLMDKYDITEIVRLIIVDKDGKITYNHVGVSSASRISKEIDAAESGEAESVEISSGVGLATLAIGAGIFAFFSPCAFPMLPGYMSYYLGKSTHAEAVASGTDTSWEEGTDVQWEFEENRKRREHRQNIRKGMFSGIATALGIVTLYLFIGILVSISGELIKDYMGFLQPIIGIILIAMGIMMVENIPIGQHIKNAWINFKYYTFEKRRVEAGGGSWDEGNGSPTLKTKLTASIENMISKITHKDFRFEQAKEEGYFGLYMFGIGYGAASASCCFPIFLAIILAALDAGGAAKGFFIFVLYAFSMAILMVIVTIFVSMSRDTIINRMRSATGMIELAGGIALQIVGLYIIYYSLNH